LHPSIGRTFKCKIDVLCESRFQSELEEVFRCEIASNSLIDNCLEIYYREADVGNGRGLSRTLSLQKWSTLWLQKAGSVHDLIAKIWDESDPVYDLAAIDTKVTFSGRSPPIRHIELNSLGQLIGSNKARLTPFPAPRFERRPRAATSAVRRWTQGMISPFWMMRSKLRPNGKLMWHYSVLHTEGQRRQLETPV
jgi:hypothetical protein